MIIKCVLVGFRHGNLNYRKPKSQAFCLKGPIPIFSSFFGATHMMCQLLRAVVVLWQPHQTLVSLRQ